MRVRIVGEADNVALQPRVVQEQRAARQAEEVEDAAGDALGDRLRVGERHQVMDLFQEADFRFQLGGVNGGVDEIAGE